MENLSKANFWDHIEKTYPDSFKLFSTWVDKYKKEVNWDKLFNSDSNYQNADGKNAPAPKFHDLPFEFQNGIIARFDIECNNGLLTGKGQAIYEANRNSYVSQIGALFLDLDMQMKKQQN